MFLSSCFNSEKSDQIRFYSVGISKVKDLSFEYLQCKENKTDVGLTTDNEGLVLVIVALENGRYNVALSNFDYSSALLKEIKEIKPTINSEGVLFKEDNFNFKIKNGKYFLTTKIKTDFYDLEMVCEKDRRKREHEISN